jgi:hypothetical protein
MADESKGERTGQQEGSYDFAHRISPRNQWELIV